MVASSERVVITCAVSSGCPGDRNNGNSNVVETNDVLFSLHAVALTLILIVQILIYRQPFHTVR